MKDPWEMFQVILHERKRREIDPTLAILGECVMEAEKSGAVDAELRKRLAAFKDFFETMNTCYEQMRKLPTPALIKFVKAGAKVRKVLGLAG